MSQALAAVSQRSQPSAARARRERDQVDAMFGTGGRWDFFTICLAVAVALHVAMLVFAVVTGLLKDLRVVVDEDRARLHEFFWRQYDVEVVKPKEEVKPEPPPPEPPPEPTPAPRAVQPKVQEDDPYKNAAPLPAQATHVITAEPKADDPVELPTIVSGDGNAVGGMMSGNGKGDQIVTNRRASNDGVQGGRGTVAAPPPPPPPPTEDRSRPVGLIGGSSWNCPFPPEADADQIDQAVVSVQVTVKPDGHALSAAVVSDPGHGFGRAARICALNRSYQPALDRSGTPIVSSNLVNVRFNR